MSRGPLKLAALLKDVADQAETHARPRVSLDVLQDANQDANAKLEKSTTARHALKIVVPLMAVVFLAGAYLMVAHLKSVTPTQQLSKATPIEAPPSPIDRTAPSLEVKELMQYADRLRRSEINFAPEITGEEAAKQLGYSRLFASAYEEMILRAKARDPSEGPPRLLDVVAGFDGIVREEQAIDQLLAQKERHVVAIAYLRALQNGDVAFPGPQPLAPTPPILLTQLMSAYSGVTFDISDPVFAAIYRDTREFASRRVKAAQEVWAQEIIGEFRRLILVSAATPEIRETQTICEQAQAVEELVAITQVCSRLRLSQAAMKVSERVKQAAQSEMECQKKAVSNLAAKLNASPKSEIDGMCQLAEQHVRTGKIVTFDIVN